MTNQSSARSGYAYQPTIIESRLLFERLAIQIAFLNQELKRSRVDFRNDPVAFVRRSTQEAARHIKKFLLAPNAVTACLTAIAVITSVVIVVFLIDKKNRLPAHTESQSELQVEIMILPEAPAASSSEARIGKDGPGRVGFQNDKGEGSGPTPKDAKGGGGGGNGNPIAPQAGKLPPPSNILAAIPTAPPINPPSLPVAGIDIDPALWKDLKAPVYGDPRSKSETPSKGPGEGEGIGTNRGPGIGEGIGPGFGRGKDGNMGGDSKQVGCCRPGGGTDEPGRTFTIAEVEQRAKLLLKPEPQYTEEARKNQVSGTVMLRVVFSSAGEVVQIRALQTLPFGLTERAIAAARQIRFVPAMRGGRPVSVHMQLEYNFNLY
jgi:TonB family protein